MDANTGMETDIIERLIRLHGMDRARDRLQRRLDQVPVKLRAFTESAGALEAAIAEQQQLARTARAEADRAELDLRTREAEREKIKRQMNAPTLSTREYLVLQEGLAGALADINSISDRCLKAMARAEEAEGKARELGGELEKVRSEEEAARAKLEGGLSGVREELERRNRERAEFVRGLPAEPLRIYDRVRRKHADALAVVEGTIDRATSRIGNDIHCSACFMAVTANDAVQVLARKRVVQCRSCARILYVP